MIVDKKKKSHSIAEAEEYCKQRGFKYCNKTPDELSIGDEIEIGNEIWRVINIKLSNGINEIDYELVSGDNKIDETNEYFNNVKATKKEKFEMNKEYYLEWLEKQRVLG